ncbi:MAG: hypothetical protein C4336_00155 [Armatimonadota bacterium]
MTRHLQHLLLFVAAFLALFVIATVGFTRGDVDRDDAARLFRKKCFRCHDARMTMRPVRPAAADSLVEAMRRYDKRWISPEEARILARYVKEMHSHPNPQQSSNN